MLGQDIDVVLTRSGLTGGTILTINQIGVVSISSRSQLRELVARLDEVLFTQWVKFEDDLEQEK